MVAPRALRVVFFGTPAFAVPTLDALLASRHEVVGVITQPDRPRGRGQNTTDGPVKARAIAAGVPVFQPRTLNDAEFISSLAAMRADIGVVAAYGKILPEAVIHAPPLGMVNVHASLLPKYRGAAPIHRAVIAGERETGVTIMRVVKALDAGAMLDKTVRTIGEDDTSEEVESDLARLGAALLASTLDRMAGDAVPEVPQDDTEANYAHRLMKDDGAVDWSRSAREIHNQIRGLHPWPHAFSFLNGERLILLRSRVADAGSSAPERGAPEPEALKPGTIAVAQGSDFVVATGRGTLALTEIQREGRRPAGARDFMAGRSVKPGDRFVARP